MPEEKSREELYKQILMYGVWLLLSISLIVLGYYLEHEFHYRLRSHIVTEIGIAGLVAIILALTIEHQSRKSEEKRAAAEREREKERQTAERERERERLAVERSAIKKDVFEHVLGYRLPDGTFAEIDNQILNASFIRKDCTFSYQLEPMELKNKQRYMKLKAKLTYKIVNLTPEKKPYDFSTIVELAPIKELNDQVKFTSVNVKGCEKLFSLDEDELKEATDDAKRPNHIMIEKKISILPEVPASATITFEAVRTLEGGHSFILHPLQTVGFDLKVGATKDIEVVATSYFREKLKEGDEHLPHINSYHWIMRSPILPYQGIYLTWKSKEAPIARKPADEGRG